MTNKIDFSTWKEFKKPDKYYGMSYPYEQIELNGKVVLEKFPFSPFMGKHDTFSCLIADVGTLKNIEFSVQVYRDNDRVGFQRGFITLQNAYEWFCNYPNN